MDKETDRQTEIWCIIIGMLDGNKNKTIFRLKCVKQQLQGQTNTEEMQMAALGVDPLRPALKQTQSTQTLVLKFQINQH